jgi:uncharacterized ion transporter superfamily protein YfcC
LDRDEEYRMIAASAQANRKIESQKNITDKENTIPKTEKSKDNLPTQHHETTLTSKKDDVIMLFVFIFVFLILGIYLLLPPIYK